MTLWGQIQGRDISFPMEVADFDAATFVFSVPAASAQAFLPGDAFEVVSVADGVAQLVMALCDYHDNPWGDYLEINLGFLARPVGAPADVIGSFVYRMPVDQAFTCEAGNRVMGFPKTVEDLSLGRSGAMVRFAMVVEGDVELAVSFPEPASNPATEGGGADGQIETVSYSYLDGVPYETPLTMDLGPAMIDPAAVKIELGDGILADELRTLGLPNPPDLATWGTALKATFQQGHPLKEAAS